MPVHDHLPPEIATRLLHWWDQGHDHPPWRENLAPYAIWVSEVMLQQTQVSTVIPYFERWMARLPTVEALAAAPLDEVLKLWQGLGYYSRARNLHKAAHQVMTQYDGVLPSGPDQLLSLPGIGRYTAGAIASIAFDRPAAVLDGNAIRVLARLTDLPEDVTRSATRRRLWELAESLVPPERPGEYNQALMELGRKVCRSARPRCSECPLVEVCQARARGSQLERPVRPPRKQTPHYAVTAAVIWRDGTTSSGQLLIAQRPLDGMLGGLWEFPGGKRKENESLVDCLAREIREELGLEIEVGEPLVTIQHAYTHFRITLHAFHCRLLSGEPEAIQVADWRWVTLDDLDDFPFPATDRKIIQALLYQPG